MPRAKDNTAGQPGETLRRLCESAGAGDAAAFSAIHQRLNGGLLRLFMQRTHGREEEAEELAQRTWVAAWRAITSGQYDPNKAAVSTFIYAIGFKVWLQQVRTAGRAAAREIGPLDGEAAELAFRSGEDPTDVTELSQLLDAVRKALHGESVSSLGTQSRGPTLTEDERSILRASALGETDRALAARLGVSPSTAHEKKKSALDRLRSLLEPWGSAKENTPPESRGQVSVQTNR